MGRISVSTGLVSGFPIESTVTSLVNLKARTRDMLTEKNKKLDQEQVAVTTLTALLIGLQSTAKSLTSASLFQQRQATSSQPDALGLTVSGQPPLGNYQFTPVQTATSQQLQSGRFASKTSPLGAGTMSLQFGGFINTATSLDMLNGGEGTARGKIRITDRSGASAEVDLSYARTADEVARLISEASGIDVTAETVGGHFRITDNSGQTTANLRVQEVGGGTTAASLGLDGINIAADSADGEDLLRLFAGVSLNTLNDGNGIRFNASAADLKVTFGDGTDASIDFRRVGVAGSRARGTTTAANGENAKVNISAVTAGSAYDGVTIHFQDDGAITQGNETAVFDAQAKTLTFKIDAGNTTANDIVRAVNTDATISAKFSASLPTGGAGVAGSGVISLGDTGVTSGPAPSATTAGTAGTNAKLLFTAKTLGAAYDDVDVEFVDNPGISAGGETVAYDDSDPSNKKLVFQIDAGNTSADQIIAALENDPAASALFSAARVTGSNGSGKINVLDGATTTGGAIVEPIAAGNEMSLADVIKTINDTAPDKLLAAISADGQRIELTDLTVSNGGVFGVTALNDSHAARDLGLLETPAGDTITGRRLLAGMNTSLLSTLNGGKGLELGQLSLTDRSGASATVNLAAAETLDDVIQAINSAGVGITASINQSRNGIEISDTTGSTAGNLIVANGDAMNSADKLGIAVDDAVLSKNSGTLNRQIVNEATLLSGLNGGAGIGNGTFKITDADGKSGTFALNSTHKTVGDLLKALNGMGLSINARVNDAGNGIALVDTAGTGNSLSVQAGNGNTARDLNLLGENVEVDVNGVPTKAINGSMVQSITLDEDDTLEDLVSKVNALGGKFTATLTNTGSTVQPYRFTLFSQVSGTAGEMLVDASQLGFDVKETVRARDALLLYGAAGDNNAVLVSSSNNTFTEVLPGTTLEVKQPTTNPVNINVTSSDTSLVAGVQAMVDAFNRLFDKTAEYTAYDEFTEKSAVLKGDGNVLRMENDLSNLISGRAFGLGNISSLAELGLGFSPEGVLQFDSSKLKARFAEDPEAVKQFFTEKETGIAARFDKIIEQLAGKDNSLLVNRAQALSRKTSVNEERIALMNVLLDNYRERLTNSFIQMELSISKIQNNLTSLNSALAGLYPQT